ncbi:MAG: type II toxin-antitoxin system VapC family toxin [Deinococcota bacterium]
MVLDTSVIIHIMTREAGWQQSLAFLYRQEKKHISAASVVETQAVLSRDKTLSKQEHLEQLNKFLLEVDIYIAPLTQKQANLAREAYLTYGKGQGHKAALNYGDVMSYALAKATGERLAFVGDDFQYTDLQVVRLPLET